jgi:hypothetical protein
MPEKDPQNWSLATWLLAISMATGGGIVNWYSRIKAGLARPYSIVELAGEIFTSGFVGIGSFMLLASMDQPTGFCAAVAGVSGHMATRLLFVIERIIESRINRMAADDDA